MTAWLFTQYQAKTEAPPSFIRDVPRFESAWHQPWSEPVRQKIVPALAIAIAASGLFSPVIGPVAPGPGYESTYHQPWSEPVRKRPEVIVGNQQFLFQNLQPPLVSFSYYNWLSEPVRQKLGLKAHLQQFDPYQVPVQPQVNQFIQWFNNLSEPVRVRPAVRTGDQEFLFFEPEPEIAMDVPWYNWLSEPVRFPKGLKFYLQQVLAMPPRLLPTPNVTVTMSAFETNTDMFLGAINVYSGGGTTAGGSGAKVSVVEVSIPGNDPVSIKES